MSGKGLHESSTQGRKRKSLSEGGVRRSKRIRSLRPDAFLPARFGPRFSPDASMNHRVILEIPNWSRRELDGWLSKLQLEKGLEYSVDLSSSDLSDFPLLSRPTPPRPGREFESFGSSATSPRLVDDADLLPISSFQGLDAGAHQEPFVDTTVLASPPSVPCPPASLDVSPIPPPIIFSPTDSPIPPPIIISPVESPIRSQAKPVIIIPSSEDDS